MTNSFYQHGAYTWRLETTDGDTLAYRPLTQDRVALFRHLQEMSLPVLPKIEFVGQDSAGNWCLIEEWVSGVTVSDMILDVQGQPRRQRALAKLLLASLCILHYHAGIIHGDIKPANIILLPDETRCAFVDLEFAHRLGDGRFARSRGYTPLYASSEQVYDGLVCRATDLRALGITLVQVMYGRHPFLHLLEGLPEPEIAHAVAQTELKPDPHDPYLCLVAKMTAVHPESRPPWTEIRRVVGL